PGRLPPRATRVVARSPCARPPVELIAAPASGPQVTVSEPCAKEKRPPAPRRHAALGASSAVCDYSTIYTRIVRRCNDLRGLSRLSRIERHVRAAAARRTRNRHD